MREGRIGRNNEVKRGGYKRGKEDIRTGNRVGE
jgi:hypothetical protein